MLLLTDNAVGSVCSCILKMVGAINQEYITCLLVHLLNYILDANSLIFQNKDKSKSAAEEVNGDGKALNVMGRAKVVMGMCLMATERN